MLACCPRGTLIHANRARTCVFLSRCSIQAAMVARCQSRGRSQCLTGGGRAQPPAFCRQDGFETATAAPPPVSDAERVERALGYPYKRPDSSFVFINGTAHAFDDSVWRGCSHLEDVHAGSDGLSVATLMQQHGVRWPKPASEQQWTPVLAVGSNAGPSQLARKFPTDLFPDGMVIPVLRGVLQDFDVVYAPLISSYGSCTATLEHSPGTAVALFVTYLTPACLARMHETEGAYNLCELDEVQLHLGLGLEQYRSGTQGQEVLSTIVQYNHQHGTLWLPFAGTAQPTPVALKEIRADARRFPALSQMEMQGAVQYAVQYLLQAIDLQQQGINHTGQALRPVNPVAFDADKAALEQWVLLNLHDGKRRLRLVEVLTANAQPFQYAKSHIEQALGDMFSENIS